MKLRLIVFLIWFMPSMAAAFVVQTTTVLQPYEPVSIVEESDTEARVVLGKLDDFPVLYEFGVDEAVEFNVRIRQRYVPNREPANFSLILVREHDSGRGVKETARLRPRTDNWSVIKDKMLGLTFWESAALSPVLEPGVYRLEVSTPDNIGDYMLLFNDDALESTGFLETLTGIRTVHDFYGLSPIAMIRSSWVYYPLFFLFLISVFAGYRKYRKIK